MLRTTTIATIAILAAGPALAYECNWGAKSAASASVAPAYSAPVAATVGTSYAQPAFTEYSTVEQPAVTYVAASPDIVDTAVNAGTFNTLVAAVQAAGLVDTLKGPGPFTVFAPTDDAFAALPAGTVENLLKPENIDRLRAVLTYHVVPGKVMSSDLAGQQLSATTVQGDTVQIDGTAGVRVDNANVVTPDVKTANGVIHVIDSVLIPNT